MATPQFDELREASNFTNPTLRIDSSIKDGVENKMIQLEQSHCDITSFNCKPFEVDMDNPKLKVLHEDRRTTHEHSKTTFFQTMVNCVSMLFGLGMLSSPYAVAQGGWAGAATGLLISAAYMYAAYLMARCVDAAAQDTYEGVAQAACGQRSKVARRVIAAVFYMEILGTLVGYCVSMGDNLARLFPGGGDGAPPIPAACPPISAFASAPPPSISFFASRNFLLSIAALIILPSVWLRNLSALSFTSLWCIASTLTLLAAIASSASTRLLHSPPLLRPKGLPIAAGLYAFSFGGTSVFPSIYASMRRRSQFPAVLLLTFLISTAATSGLGVVGAAMYGDATASQVTLSMPLRSVTTKVVLWMTVLTPLFKFALQLSPVTAAIEGKIRRRYGGGGGTRSNATDGRRSSAVYAACTLMRSAMLAAIVVFSMLFPYFETIASLIGSSMTIAICLIFPSFFYLRLHWVHLSVPEIVAVSAVATAGGVVGVYGTVVAVQGVVARS